ncbi:phage holin family protein [Chloroflexota bacterium]
MNTLRHLFRFIIRFLVVWFVDTISLLVTAWIIPGINFVPADNIPVFVVAIAAALVLGIVNLVVRPLILMLAMPLGWMVIFLVGFFINAFTLKITSALLPSFEVTTWGWAFVGGLLISLVNTILTTLLDIDNSESFYQNLVLRQAARQAVEVDEDAGRGVVMLEIDGLSYWHIQKAVEDGYMPTIKKLIDEGGYEISRMDCGVPSSTPACQAGILQGNNANMPAFRWLDKETNRIIAGGPQMAEVEPLLSDGHGLLEGGTSIGNMFSGDADKSILTFTKITSGSEEDKKKRARDMYMLMRNPYFFMRVLVLFFVDVFRELWQSWQQRRKNVQPQLNRLHNGYPFLRAATNVFLRDVGVYFTILDIVRGVPAIYTLWAGYDEVAHHSGPWTRDAMLTLSQFDRTVSYVLTAIERHAPRPYELIMLSDHGQSFGQTFLQRYEMGILDFVKSQLPQDTSAVATGGGDDGTIGVSAMLGELQNMDDNKMTGMVGDAVVNQAQQAMQSNLDQQPSSEEVEPAKLTLSYSGNMALLYFDLYPRKITLNELNAAYPDMVDNLVQHEGIGFVVAYDDEFVPVAFGENGARNLHTGDVTGEDPFAPYGDVELRSWQVRRIADFPNCGDLILNSPVYPDGTVAAYEELIGSHGGLGGEQTDAFIFHPGDMEIPETRNSMDFMPLLKGRVGMPGLAPKPELPPEPKVNAWALGNLAKGLGQMKTWLDYAVRAITLSRATYQAIAKDAYMTAPALLITLLSQILQSLNNEGSLDMVNILLRYGVWLLAVLFLYLAAFLLRGKADYTTTLRVAGFAQSAHLLEIFGFLPVIGPAMRFLALLLAFFGVWIGAATAHELRGWRTLLLPVIFIATTVITVVFLAGVIEGTAFAIENILQDFGLASGQ